MASKTIPCGGNVTGVTTPSLSSRHSIVDTRQLSLGHFKTVHCPPLKLGVCRATVKRNPKRLRYSVPRFNKEGDGFVYVEADPAGSDSWKLEPVVKLLQEGAVGVIPTDTVWNSTYLRLATAVKFEKAFERLKEDDKGGYAAFFARTQEKRKVAERDENELDKDEVGHEL